MFYRESGEVQVRSLPASWTDIGGPDPYLSASAGRSRFRVDDLLALTTLVRELWERGCK